MKISLSGEQLARILKYAILVILGINADSAVNMLRM